MVLLARYQKRVKQMAYVQPLPFEKQKALHKVLTTSRLTFVDPHGKRCDRGDMLDHTLRYFGYKYTSQGICLHDVLCFPWEENELSVDVTKLEYNVQAFLYERMVQPTLERKRKGALKAQLERTERKLAEVRAQKKCKT